MSDNQRKLLPYEHQLIEALGITKEEYLDFVAQQHIYEDPKAGTVLDARNWEAVAIVLAVVGILAQVASVLLSPKPQVPQAPKLGAAGSGGRPGQAGSRDDVFAPRYGFNSAQQLATYGDPINLVYTNIDTNPNGGIKVATSLIFSAIKSFGSSQFIEMLSVIGAGGIEQIDIARSSFGQLPFRSLPPQNYWVYFKPGSTGILRNENKIISPQGINDPGDIGGPQQPRYIPEIRLNGVKSEGFSHTYSPSSSNVFGIYGVVPSNVDFLVRNQDGFNQKWNISVTVRGATGGYNPPIPDPNILSGEGQEWRIALGQYSPRVGNVASEETNDLRRGYSQVFDMGATFKYGALKLKVINMSRSDIIDGPMFVTTRAINTARSVSLRDGYTDFQLAPQRPLNFHVKALVRIEEASYETISPCQIVDFSIRAKVFMRISGRQARYGTGDFGYKPSDNGIKPRSAMFILKVKNTNQPNYAYFPGIFVVNRAADNDAFIQLRFDATNIAPSSWQFKFEPIYDPAAEVGSIPELRQSDGNLVYHYLESGGNVTRYTVDAFSGASIEYYGTPRIAYAFYPPTGRSVAQGINSWDIFRSDSDQQIQYSFDNGPEFSITAVTEHIISPFGSFPGLYDNISLIGFNTYASKTIQDLRSFSVFVRKGRKVRGLITNRAWGLSPDNYLSSSPDTHANYAPDIFLDTVLDQKDGIGKYTSIYSVDLEQLAKSKKFCMTNGLFMDGVIAEPSSWRAFWSSVAGYSLLELAKVGGQEMLIPAVPYDVNTGRISDSLPITALFNQGNILEESYKEEFVDYGSNSQDIVARIIYREADQDSSFFKNTSVDVQLSDTLEEYSVQQTIDASQFVCRRDQAILLGKFLCLSKRYSRRSIEFKTFPTDSPVFPGAYIYVELAQNSWERIYSGIVEDNGVLNSPFNIPAGNYAALCYKHGTNTTISGPSGVQYFSSITIDVDAQGQNQSPQLTSSSGRLFVLGNTILNKRVFRVTEVAMDEEGEVTIRGVEHPTNAAGRSLIGQNLLQGSWSIT
jgi:hypothetical protein